MARKKTRKTFWKTRAKKAVKWRRSGGGTGWATEGKKGHYLIRKRGKICALYLPGREGDPILCDTIKLAKELVNLHNRGAK